MKIPRRLLVWSPLLCLLLCASCGGSDNYESADLEDAYEAIGESMSYTYVRGIIGTEPASHEADGRSVSLYRWETGRGTRLFTQLLVRIHVTDGVLSKAVTGPGGSKSETF